MKVSEREKKVEKVTVVETVQEAEEPRRFTLRKSEKLRHRTLVEGLFNEGTTLYDYPLRVTYRVLDQSMLEGAFRNGIPDRVGSLQMLITVPKKKLRHAVDRVKIRRRIREAYRLNRHLLREAAEKAGVRSVDMAFIYIHGGESDYGVIEKKMKRLLTKIAGRVEESL